MKNEITYTEINGINYPNLCLPEQPNVNIGKYGHMRLDFLKKHRRGTYTTLLTEGKLSAHLFAIDQEARAQVEYLTTKLAKKRGIDESIKVDNPLLWVQEMNNCKASAEEVVVREVICQ
ncbi:MAG: TnpV protein [Eubacteriales bacterium]